MTRTASPRLTSYAVLGVVGLLAALVFGRPELVALAAPFLLALGVGLASAATPRLTASFALDAARAVEGDEVTGRVTVAAAGPVDRLDVYVPVPQGLEVAHGDNPLALVLRPGVERELPLTLRAARWGGYAIGPLFLRARDAAGLLAWEAVVAGTRELRVYPREPTLQRVVRPVETQVFAGNEVARTKGDGIEFADIRPWAPGDVLRRVNWRASARRGELWVNESHPERNTDVILFVDSFAEARTGGAGTLDLSVRATAALADAYLRRRDRVGLIGFGGILRWLVPGTGVAQLYRIVDALIDTQIVLSYYWRELDVIPRRTLPPNALVVALTPLLDPRSVAALLDLRNRGYDLAVVDVSPVPFALRPAEGDARIAFDLWKLRREAIRHRLTSAGVAVVEWQEGTPLQAIVEEVRQFRRYAWRARG
ncbi:MAG TPA: DUF58 domain-containing protein [Gaiellaceae bacterium]|nr:DUF58 domain-containing protein [Gaiellaceae bacterium]